MKRTIAAIMAFLCIAGGIETLSVNPSSTSKTAITETAAATTIQKGLNAAKYSYKYADPAVYKTNMTAVSIVKDGKTVNSWVDETNGNTYSIYKVTVDSLEDNTNVVTEYRLGLNKIKNAVLDANFAEEITIPGEVVTSVNEKYGVSIVGKTATVIGASALANSYVKNVDLTGVEYIGTNAFNKCLYITEITIPKTVKFVGDSVFSYSGLKTLTVNNEMIQIPSSFCSDTALTKVTFAHPEYIRVIGTSAFKNTPLNAPVFNEWADIDTTNFENVQVLDSAYENCKSIKEVLVSDNILSLGKNVFKNGTSIQTLKFGKICLYADNSCFYGCTALSSITFNNVLHSLGGSCFTGCTSLKTVTGIPTTIFDWDPEDATLGNGMGDGVFSGCTSLTGVILPDSLTRVPGSMFKGDTKLTVVKFGKPTDTLSDTDSGASGKNIVKIKKNAFSDCTSLTSAIFPNTTRIEKEAFSNCSSMKTFQSGECTIVGDSALSGCSSLTEITLLADQYGGDETTDPNITNSSSGYVFKNCSSAKKITIKTTGKTKLSSGLFSGCTALTEVGGDLSGISIIGKECFNNCSALKKLNFDNLVVIENSGFANCSELKSISDAGNALQAQDYGDKAFQNCSKLDIIITGKISTIGAYAFQKSAITQVDIDGMVGGTVVIGSNAFSDCENLTAVKILSPGVDKFQVGTGIFTNCPILKTAEYQGPIITSGMFKNCPLLESVVTTADVFNSSAFENCPKLTMVTEMGKTTPIIAKQIDSAAFAGCSALKSTSATANTIFNGTTQYQGCTSLTGANVSALTAYMFKDCINLSSIKITNVESVPNYCFQNCTALKSFDFTNIKSIGVYAFEKSGIGDITLSGISKIDTSAFSGCTNMTKADISADSIGANAFANCSNLASASINTVKIGSSAFAGNAGLTSVSIKNTDDTKLETIDSSAFNNCPQLKTLTVPGSPTIASYAIGYTGGKVIEDFVLGGTKGSSVQEYATKNKLNFKDESGNITVNQTTTTTKATTTTTKKVTTTTTAKPTTTTSKPVTTTTKNGSGSTTTVKVAVKMYGDANNDGQINLADTVMIMQALVNSPKYGLTGSDKSHITAQGWANADCAGNNDGVTNLDALAIQKYKLGLIDALPEK